MLIYRFYFSGTRLVAVKDYEFCKEVINAEVSGKNFCDIFQRRAYNAGGESGKLRAGLEWSIPFVGNKEFENASMC